MPRAGRWCALVASWWAFDGIFTKEADIDGGVNFAVSLPMIEQSLEAMRADGVQF